MTQIELASTLGIKPSQLCRHKAKGCPVDDVGKAKAWIMQHIKRRTKRNAAPANDIPPAEANPVDPDYSWEARLDRARKMEVQVFEAAKAAVDRKEFASLQSLLASYQRALQGISEAEEIALESRIKSGELIHRDTCREILVELLQPIRNAIDLLPVTERSRCNPNAPEIAQGALTVWRDALLQRLSTAETKF